MKNKIIESAEKIQALAEKMIELAEEVKRDLKAEINKKDIADSKKFDKALKELFFEK